MLQRKTRFLVPLFALCVLLAAAGSAVAQVNYQITSTPTFVINTGRAEVLGAVRVTSQSTAGTLSVSSTLEFLYRNVGCDNTTANGISLLMGGVFIATTTAISGVQNSSGGCVVSVTVPAGIVMSGTSGADYVEVRSARGRIDLSPAGAPSVGVDVTAVLNATPSGSSLFTAPSEVRVATSALGRTVSVRNGIQLYCVLPPPSPTPRVRIAEGFNGAFVHHVASLAGTAAPGDARPAAGATNNTWIRITVTDIPAGVILTWPSPVAGINVSTSAVSAGSLERRTAATDTVQVYEFVTTSQGTSDINTEQFDIVPTVGLPPTLVLGTANVQVQLAPLLVTGDATSVTSAATLVAGTKPRFNDPLTEVKPLLTISPCATNLLFPFVANVLGFDTGIAIANTSSDPFGTVGALRQSGTCTLTGYPLSGAASVSFTTVNVATGSTYVTVLSSADNTVFNGFQGYIIARCNFQYGHGYAFITDGFGGTPIRAQGYVALVIPDPFILGARGATTAPVVANVGEGLNQ